MNAIEITIIGRERPDPLLVEVLAYLDNVNLIYEIGRLGTDDSYAQIDLPPPPLFWSYRRQPSALADADRLILDYLSHESPTKLIAKITCTAAAISAMWALVQMADYIEMKPQNREKLRLEIENLRMEHERLEKERGYPFPLTEHQAAQKIAERHGHVPLKRTSEWLARSPVRIEEVGVRLVDK
jgi:hypothetical protein